MARINRIRLVHVSDKPPTVRVEDAGDAVRYWEAFAIVVGILALYGAAAWFIWSTPMPPPMTPERIHECRISYGCFPG